MSYLINIKISYYYNIIMENIENPKKNNELQKLYYNKAKQNEEWRKKFNERCKENNRKYRERKRLEKPPKARGRPKKSIPIIITSLIPLCE